MNNYSKFPAVISLVPLAHNKRPPGQGLGGAVVTLSAVYQAVKLEHGRRSPVSAKKGLQQVCWRPCPV